MKFIPNLIYVKQSTKHFISINIEPSACFNRQFCVIHPKLSEKNP